MAKKSSSSKSSSSSKESSSGSKTESVTGLKGQLTKAQNRIAELEAENADLRAAAGPFGLPPEEPPVAGPNAEPIEQR